MARTPKSSSYHPDIVTTMAQSLVSRSPFLDLRFAEFMARVPVGFKVCGRRLRYLERELVERHLLPRNAS